MRLLSPLPATFSAVCLFRARVAFTQSSLNFSVPTSWQNTTSSLSRDDRQAIAQSAIQRIPPPTANGNGTLDVSGYQFDHVETSSLLSVLFLYDFFSGTTTNKESATIIYQEEFKDPPTTNISHILHWGLANYYAYRVYQDDKFLQEAIGSWKNASGNMLTQGAIQNGTLEINPNGTSQNTVQMPVPSLSCSTPIGAVFEFPDQDHLSTVIKGETMSAFLALSTYLSGENQTFSEAASLSAEFIQAHMINNTIVNPLQLDLSLDSCAVTPDEQSGMMNIGLIIEGLSVWANQTSNVTLSNTVNDLILRSINHTWTGSNGVITQGSDDSPEVDESGAKAWFIRGLHEAWSRMSDKSLQPASLIAAYITAQFNALHNMSPNGNYSMNWSLPSTNASATFDPWAQVVALDVLNSAFDIVPPATNSTSASSSSLLPKSTASSEATPLARSSTSHVGAIAGGTVGGGVAIAVAVGAAIFFFRRRKYRTVNKAPSSFFADRLVSPPSAALIDQVQDYGLSRVEKRGHEESDSTESSLGIAV